MTKILLSSSLPIRVAPLLRLPGILQELLLGRHVLPRHVPGAAAVALRHGVLGRGGRGRLALLARRVASGGARSWQSADIRENIEWVDGWVGGMAENGW